MRLTLNRLNRIPFTGVKNCDHIIYTNAQRKQNDINREFTRKPGRTG
jgi:hypothetical protein